MSEFKQSAAASHSTQLDSAPYSASVSGASPPVSASSALSSSSSSSGSGGNPSVVLDDLCRIAMSWDLNDQLLAARLFLEQTQHGDERLHDELVNKALGILCKLMASHNSTVQTHSIQTIALLSRHGKYHPSMAAHNLIARLLDQLVTCRDARVLEALLAALTHLAKTHSACTIICERGFASLLPLLDTAYSASVGVQCFAESDTRILTSCGLLFVSEIEERLGRGEKVQYACYERSVLDEAATRDKDVLTGRLVYCDGRLLLPHEASAQQPNPPPPPDELLVFAPNAGGKQGSGLDGTTKEGELDEEREGQGEDDELLLDLDHGKDLIREKHISLRVTPNHRMYVQRGEYSTAEGGTRWTKSSYEGDGSRIDSPPTLIPARQLLADCSCVIKDCQHQLQYIRMLACATVGLRPTAEQRSLVRDELVRGLGLTTARFHPFLELLGFWVGASVSSSHNGGSINSHNSAHISCSVRAITQQHNVDWLKRVMAAVGLRLNKDYSLHRCACAHKQHAVSAVPTVVAIHEPRWLALFEHDLTTTHNSAQNDDWSAGTHADGMIRNEHDEVEEKEQGRAITSQDEDRNGAVERGRAQKDKRWDATSDRVAIANSQLCWRCWSDIRRASGHAAQVDRSTPLCSAQSIPQWVLMCLTRKQSRSVIRGLWRATSSHRSKQQRSIRIHTSRSVLRDQTVQLLLHCGFSPSVRSLQRSETEQTIRCGASDHWVIEWEKPHGLSGELSCWPTLHPRSDISRQRYCRARDGRIWCVHVAHPDHIIVAQRVVRGDKGQISMQSRPVLVGNCNTLALIGALASYSSLQDYMINHDILHYLYRLRDSSQQPDIRLNSRYCLRAAGYTDDDPSPHHVEVLNAAISMGFPRGRCEHAIRTVKMTRMQGGGDDMQAVSTYLLDHNNEPPPMQPIAVGGGDIHRSALDPSHGHGHSAAPQQQQQQSQLDEESRDSSRRQRQQQQQPPHRSGEREKVAAIKRVARERAAEVTVCSSSASTARRPSCLFTISRAWRTPSSGL